jgi:hypothetical protein
MAPHLDFDVIATTALITVTGGSDDPGADTVARIEQRLRKQGDHERATVDAAKKHQWGKAFKEGATSFYAGLETGKEIARPLKPIWDAAIDIAGVAGKK